MKAIHTCPGVTQDDDVLIGVRVASVVVASRRVSTRFCRLFILNELLKRGHYEEEEEEIFSVVYLL